MVSRDKTTGPATTLPSKPRRHPRTGPTQSRAYPGPYPARTCFRSETRPRPHTRRPGTTTDSSPTSNEHPGVFTLAHSTQPDPTLLTPTGPAGTGQDTWPSSTPSRRSVGSENSGSIPAGSCPGRTDEGRSQNRQPRTLPGLLGPEGRPWCSPGVSRSSGRPTPG